VRLFLVYWNTEVTAMTHIITAVFENGILRPVGVPSPPLQEGQQVRLIVDDQVPEDPLVLARRVYEGLTEEEVEEVERIALDRSHFFGPSGS
jgi:predicted DNA-binding antitoxin AbrB/MazE fold protein